MATVIHNVETYSELKFLYNNWALTYEGLDPADIHLVVDYLKEHTRDPIEPEAYIIKGQYMNEVCKLTGRNSYPDDLHIIAFYPFGTVIALSIGARWMADIIDNNASRENYHPFNAKYIYDEDDEDDYEYDFDDDDDDNYFSESTQDLLAGDEASAVLEFAVRADEVPAFQSYAKNYYNVTLHTLSEKSPNGWLLVEIKGQEKSIKEYIWNEYMGMESPVDYADEELNYYFTGSDTPDNYGADHVPGFYGKRGGSEEADDLLFALQVWYGQPKYSYDDFRKMDLTPDNIKRALQYVKGRELKKSTFFNDNNGLLETTQAAAVSVGEIYDYLKKSTLVSGATIDDILKDPEATAWEYAYQKISTTHKDYDEDEFLDVYSKALKTLRKGKR